MIIYNTITIPNRVVKMKQNYTNYDRRYAEDFYDFDDSWKLSIYLDEDEFF